MDSCRVGPRSWSLAPYDSVTGTEDKRFSHLNISSFIEGARSMIISRYILNPAHRPLGLDPEILLQFNLRLLLADEGNLFYCAR